MRERMGEEVRLWGRCSWGVRTVLLFLLELGMQQNTLLLVPDMVEVEKDGLFKVLERIRWSSCVRRENMQLQVGNNNDKDITKNNENGTSIFFISCCERERKRKQRRKRNVGCLLPAHDSLPQELYHVVLSSIRTVQYGTWYFLLISRVQTTRDKELHVQRQRTTCTYQ
jgi:hypothetical protein